MSDEGRTQCRRPFCFSGRTQIPIPEVLELNEWTVHLEKKVTGDEPYLLQENCKFSGILPFYFELPLSLHPGGTDPVPRL